MLENQKFRPAQVIGPLGEPMTLDSLPPPQTNRWVVRRKAEVVAGLGLAADGRQACRIPLSLVITLWQRAVDRSGMPGFGSPVQALSGRFDASSVTDAFPYAITEKQFSTVSAFQLNIAWTQRQI